MPSIRESEGDRYSAPRCRADLVEALVITPGPFDDTRIDDEMFDTRQANDATTRTFKSTILRVLMQVNFLVIRGLALGNLPEEARTTLDTFFTNDYINLGDNVPGVYVNYIVDENGIAPTKADIIEILAVMREYLGNDSEVLAEQVDAQFGGSRKEWRYAHKPETKRVQAAFIKGMEKRLGIPKGADAQDSAGSEADIKVEAEPAGSEVDVKVEAHSDADADADAPSRVPATAYAQSDDDMDTPIPCGISEVGFSITPLKRIQDHQKHTNSNSIMNLFEAAARYLFGNRYAIQGYVVARVVDPTLAGLSEAVISRLACSYTDWGGGFNGKLAGLSVHGLNNMPTVLADTKLTREAWITHEANEDMANVEDERVRVQERIAFLEQRIASRHDRHNYATERCIDAAEAYLLQSGRRADAYEKIKEEKEKWEEFKRKAEEEKDPDWLKKVRDVCGAT
ncbi:hypothetical protein VE01_10675 [Pseudogymnoascus verrucosus]|uniref:Uncharacterized protein n=1 Tax=Pseudogymnoascus verrucosus TaxID=342668 RepID=A0A1B8G691_9PEZI|nr:uncharacterized protein VE01_10675 [Pseudogymnoascus verrucosus]OBT91344.1 hypothetical protein VE01_10675 [Pseudogymnoascus verrucosus]